VSRGEDTKRNLKHAKRRYRFAGKSVCDLAHTHSTLAGVLALAHVPRSKNAQKAYKFCLPLVILALVVAQCITHPIVHNS
jgi:hypothetical protein